MLSLRWFMQAYLLYAIYNFRLVTGIHGYCLGIIDSYLYFAEACVVHIILMFTIQTCSMEVCTRLHAGAKPEKFRGGGFPLFLVVFLCLLGFYHRDGSCFKENSLLHISIEKAGFSLLNDLFYQKILFIQPDF